MPAKRAELARIETQAAAPDFWSDKEAAQEWIIATKGVRVCNTYGTWRGFKLLEAKEDATDWTPVCSMNDLVRRVSEGEVHAMNLLIILRPPGLTDSS